MHDPQPFTFHLPAPLPWPGASTRAPAPARPLARDADAPLATRWVWHSRFGSIVIEVRGGDVFVNGDRVEPHAP